MSSTYAVRVGFVDSTYWDDGSRWTSRTFRFNRRKEAVDFAIEASTKGCSVRGKNGELFVHPEEADISVERTSTTQVKWATESNSTDSQEKE